MTRRALLAANWKMNHLRAETRSYADALAAGLDEIPDVPEIALFPPATSLALLVDRLGALHAGDRVAVGGQDLHPEAQGAHTGDLSGEMLADCGAVWGLCGHSERRHDHGEDDSLVQQKVTAAVRAGLRPMLCLGETLEQRESDNTDAVLDRQLVACLEVLGSARDWQSVALAYEPVWAIGTGRTATPEMAQAAHEFLRRRVAEECGQPAADSLRILYGGSVKPANCEELIRQTDIDGFLIGGAGLDPEQFLDIIRRCAGSS
jgi:triosephosphate isomerase